MQVLELPPLPRNVRVEYHPNGCYDWGTIGWLLDSDKVDVRPYKYFIFMNSSVRGPFLPVFNKVRQHCTGCMHACRCPYDCAAVPCGHLLISLTTLTSVIDSQQNEPPWNGC